MLMSKMLNGSWVPCVPFLSPQILPNPSLSLKAFPMLTQGTWSFLPFLPPTQFPRPASAGKA